MFSVHPLKSQVALLVTLVNFVSTTLYAAKCLGHVTVVASGVPGEHMMPLRYLQARGVRADACNRKPSDARCARPQWCFTTCCLIRTLACLSPDGPRSRRVLRQTVLADWGMLATGAAERVLPAPLSYVFYILSSLFFVQTLRGQYTLFAFGTQTLSTVGDLRALRALRKMTTLTWCLFPAARLACMAHVLGTNGEEVVFSLLDILAKFMYSTFLMVTRDYTGLDKL
jgi:bacteriorhodopsin